jgi:hypothetical protein
VSGELDQDPGIPGRETASDPGPAPIPDDKDEEAERREPLEDPDREGQLG